MGWEILLWPSLDNTVAIVRLFCHISYASHVQNTLTLSSEASDLCLIMTSAQNLVSHHLSPDAVEVPWVCFLRMITLAKDLRRDKEYAPTGLAY